MRQAIIVFRPVPTPDNEFYVLEILLISGRGTVCSLLAFPSIVQHVTSCYFVL